MWKFYIESISLKLFKINVKCGKTLNVFNLLCNFLSQKYTSIMDERFFTVVE